jgi:hypothetical protein
MVLIVPIHVYVLDLAFFVVTIAAVATVMKCGPSSKIGWDTVSCLRILSNHASHILNLGMEARVLLL